MNHFWKWFDVMMIEMMKIYCLFWLNFKNMFSILYAQILLIFVFSTMLKSCVPRFLEHFPLSCHTLAFLSLFLYFLTLLCLTLRIGYKINPMQTSFPSFMNRELRESFLQLQPRFCDFLVLTQWWCDFETEIHKFSKIFCDERVAIFSPFSPL